MKKKFVKKCQKKVEKSKKKNFIFKNVKKKNKILIPILKKVENEKKIFVKNGKKKLK